MKHRQNHEVQQPEQCHHICGCLQVPQRAEFPTDPQHQRSGAKKQKECELLQGVPQGTLWRSTPVRQCPPLQQKRPTLVSRVGLGFPIGLCLPAFGYIICSTDLLACQERPSRSTSTHSRSPSVLISTSPCTSVRKTGRGARRASRLRRAQPW